MTSTDKAVTRVTRAAYSVLYPAPRQIVVSIGPGDVLRFREKGRHEEWSVGIGEAFRLCVRRRAGV